MKKNKVIIFDCDGTLLDTFQLIEKTVYLTFAKMLPEYKLTLEEAHSFFGPLLKDSFKKYAKTEEELNQFIECYRRISDSLMPKYTYTYDGIESLLIELKKQNYIIVIVSNKVTIAVEQGLKICGIEKYFDDILGADKLKTPKPNPDGIFQVIKKYQTNQAIMVGDTIIDIKAGQNANIKTIGVTWCKTSKKEFQDNNATFVVDYPNEIIKIVGEL